MGHACGCRTNSAGILDVRDMAPRLRHPEIFTTFDALAAGESLILVSDHDLEPLFYQFTFERPGAFGWRYLEDGPEVWRVEIGKPAGAITADQTVGDVVHQDPGTLEVMNAKGINHCCGAELTLTEAAASAGVPLEELLEALNTARDAGG
ncbi:MAG: hypothetical protein C5B48_09170 [Candidatus Rokuibacteriota bacterium]|nr:MAG: hypothetical protein C5B48_09170 [Candidatus Rokubacteria bacterium]